MLLATLDLLSIIIVVGSALLAGVSIGGMIWWIDSKVTKLEYRVDTSEKNVDEVKDKVKENTDSNVDHSMQITALKTWAEAMAEKTGAKDLPSINITGSAQINQGENINSRQN